MVLHCPICQKPVNDAKINSHIDSDCKEFIVDEPDEANQGNGSAEDRSSFFRLMRLDRSATKPTPSKPSAKSSPSTVKRPAPKADSDNAVLTGSQEDGKPWFPSSGERPAAGPSEGSDRGPKRIKTSNAFHEAAPLAERMRPRTMDDVCGQELVGRTGILRGLIEDNRVPSMILWGGAGTGKTTIARVIATMVGSRFVEINSTSTGVAECKKIFAEARNELSLTGRKTIIFCDEIHRFTKAQQDVFLGPVESGHVTLIGATTENPSFKVQNALLSRCRTFTLAKLSEDDIMAILNRALEVEGPNYSPSSLVDNELIRYLAAFADGDARTALNLCLNAPLW